MKRISPILALAAVLAGGALVSDSPAAFAQGMGPGMMGGGMGMHGGFTSSTAYLDAVKKELNITPAQEPAWNDYAGTVKTQAEQLQAQHQTMYQSMATMTWEQRQTLMNQMFEKRQQSAAAVHAAADKLVASLDDAQKTKAQTLLPGLRYGGGMMQGGGMMGGPGPRRP